MVFTDTPSPPILVFSFLSVQCVCILILIVCVVTSVLVCFEGVSQTHRGRFCFPPSALPLVCH